MANMNKVILLGRLTDDPKLSTTPKGVSVASFSIAINRPTEGVDFPRCKAWGKTAEFICRYFHKGNTILITDARIETGSYEKNGTKVYTTDVVAEKVDFVDKKNESTLEARVEMNDAPNLEEIGENEELPF